MLNWSKQLILAVSLFALGTLAYWLEYKHKPEQEASTENSKKVFALKDKQIQTIHLSDGGKTFAWECQDLQAKTCKPGDNSKWKMTEPMQARADDSNLNSLVSTLNNLNTTESIDLKDETADKRASLLKEYGMAPESLSSPSVRRVSVKTEDGETVAYFGTTNPINENIFAVVENVSKGQNPAGKPDTSKVYQVPGFFKSSFDHDLAYWRDKRVLAFVASEIESFEIRSRANGTISGQKKNGEWTLKTAGTEYSGDFENVETFLNGAAYLTAKNFVSDNHSDEKAKAILKGNPEVVSVTFQKAQGASKEASAPVVLTLYSKSNSKKQAEARKTPPKHSHDHEHELDQGAGDSTPVYAISSGADPLYELQTSAIHQFDKSLKDLRLVKLITTTERFNARKLEFGGTPMGATPLVLVSDGTKWTQQGEKTEISSDKVQSTLDHLTGNRIKEFLTGAAIPSGQESGLQLTLGDDKNPAKRKLLFWKKDGKLYARDLNSVRKEAFLVDSSVADGLPWDRNYFSGPKK